MGIGTMSSAKCVVQHIGYQRLELQSTVLSSEPNKVCYQGSEPHSESPAEWNQGRLQEPLQR